MSFFLHLHLLSLPIYLPIHPLVYLLCVHVPLIHQSLMRCGLPHPPLVLYICPVLSYSPLPYLLQCVCLVLSCFQLLPPLIPLLLPHLHPSWMNYSLSLPLLAHVCSLFLLLCLFLHLHLDNPHRVSIITRFFGSTFLLRPFIPPNNILSPYCFFFKTTTITKDSPCFE